MALFKYKIQWKLPIYVILAFMASSEGDTEEWLCGLVPCDSEDSS